MSLGEDSMITKSNLDDEVDEHSMMDFGGKVERRHDVRKIEPKRRVKEADDLSRYLYPTRTVSEK